MLSITSARREWMRLPQISVEPIDPKPGQGKGLFRVGRSVSGCWENREAHRHPVIG